MVKYVAFLRGINVGGKKLIKMEELRRVIESLRFRNVRTFIASGNVLFESPQTNRAALTTKIEKEIRKVFGHEVAVVLLTVSELEAILKLDPFRKIKADVNTMICVVFLAAEPKLKTKLPFVSSAERLEVLAIKNRAAFILCRRKPNGSFAFPNNFLEKEFGVAATTRNWNTVQRIVALAHSLN